MPMCEGSTGGNDGTHKQSDPQLGGILAWSLAPTGAKALSQQMLYP